MNLTITKPDVPCQTTYGSVSATAEGSYVWFGETYTQSGQYQHTIQNVAGCDSIITLNLTITKPDVPCQTTYGSVSATAEGSYVWFGETYTESGTYQHTIQNVAGCDSVITLELTITEPPCRPFVLTLTTANKEAGTVQILQEPSCENGQMAMISATASGNYRFNQWSDGSTENPRTLILTGDMTLYALFTIKQYSVSAAASNPSAGTVFGSGVYDYGTQVTLTASANSGYVFSNWSDGVTDNPRVITVVSDTVLKAVFSEAYYTITAAVNNPALGYTTGSGNYAGFSFATLTAVAYENSTFVRWSDGITSATRRVLVLEDATYTAIFEANRQYHISIICNDNTMGTVEGSGEYYQGETAVLRAIPNDGYIFLKWFDGNTDNPRSVVVTQDKTYKAYFVSVTALENNELTGVVVSGHTVYVEGHEGESMQVYTPAGQTVYDGSVQPVEVPKMGMYLIRIGSQVARVFVR